MARTLLSAAFAFTVACASPDPVAACESYLDAASACLDEAFIDDAVGADVLAAGLAGACDGIDTLTGDEAADAADSFECQADAFAEADCSTPESYTSITAGLISCL